MAYKRCLHFPVSLPCAVVLLLVPPHMECRLNHPQRLGKGWETTDKRSKEPWKEVCQPQTESAILARETSLVDVSRPSYKELEVATNLMDSDAVGWGVDGMRSQSKGLQHAPMNARKCFQHGIAPFSFHFLLVGVCCLRVSADKPSHDGFATLRFCRGMLCGLLIPFLVFKGKSQGFRLDRWVGILSHDIVWFRSLLLMQ